MSTAGRLAEHPAIVALRNAPVSDLPLAPEERATLEAAQKDPEVVPHAAVLAALVRSRSRCDQPSVDKLRLIRGDSTPVTGSRMRHVTRDVV